LESIPLSIAVGVLYQGCAQTRRHGDVQRVRPAEQELLLVVTPLQSDVLDSTVEVGGSGTPYPFSVLTTA
jgi:hypothetical protein